MIGDITMILKDATSFPKPISVPIIAKSKVTVLTNCSLTEDEVTLFNASIKAVCEYIQTNNIDLADYFAFNIIFTQDDSFSFIPDKNTACGHQFQLAIYNMNKIRSFHNNELTVFVFIEEF